MRRRGETREHTYRMILLDPRFRGPAERERERDFRARKMRRHARGKVVVFRKREEPSHRGPFRGRKFFLSNELKIYHEHGDFVFSTRNSSLIPLSDPVFLHSTISVYRFFIPPPPPLSLSFFLSFSVYLFLFTFLAAPLPYKLISRLPRTDGVEQLNSLFPFTYPFVSTFTFIFE